MTNHVLYKTSDPDVPDRILDRNGQVTLDMCKVCGAAESELNEYPECPIPPLDSNGDRWNPSNHYEDCPVRDGPTKPCLCQYFGPNAR